MDDRFDLVWCDGRVQGRDGGVEGAHPLIEFVDERNDVVEADAGIGIDIGRVALVLGERPNRAEQTADVVGDVPAGFADGREALVLFGGFPESLEFQAEFVDVVDNRDKFLVADG